MKFTLMSLFLLLCAIATVAGIIWTILGGWADGSWLAILIPGAIGIGVARYTKRSTGSYTSDSSGGR
jgi:hypothetical protein